MWDRLRCYLNPEIQWRLHDEEPLTTLQWKYINAKGLRLAYTRNFGLKNYRASHVAKCTKAYMAKRQPSIESLRRSLHCVALQEARYSSSAGTRPWDDWDPSNDDATAKSILETLAAVLKTELSSQMISATPEASRSPNLPSSILQADVDWETLAQRLRMDILPTLRQLHAYAESYEKDAQGGRKYCVTAELDKWMPDCPSGKAVHRIASYEQGGSVPTMRDLVILMALATSLKRSCSSPVWTSVCSLTRHLAEKSMITSEDKDAIRNAIEVGMRTILDYACADLGAPKVSNTGGPDSNSLRSSQTVASETGESTLRTERSSRPPSSMLRVCVVDWGILAHGLRCDLLPTLERLRAYAAAHHQKNYRVVQKGLLALELDKWLPGSPSGNAIQRIAGYQKGRSTPMMQDLVVLTALAEGFKKSNSSPIWVAAYQLTQRLNHEGTISDDEKNAIRKTIEKGIQHILDHSAAPGSATPKGSIRSRIASKSRRSSETSPSATSATNLRTSIRNERKRSIATIDSASESELLVSVAQSGLRSR